MAAGDSSGRRLYWDESDLLLHVIGGIRMTAGVERFNCYEEH